VLRPEEDNVDARLRLALEASQALGVGREGGRLHLDCDLPFELSVVGAVNLAHAALTPAWWLISYGPKRVGSKDLQSIPARMGAT